VAYQNLAEGIRYLRSNFWFKEFYEQFIWLLLRLFGKGNWNWKKWNLMWVLVWWSHADHLYHKYKKLRFFNKNSARWLRLALSNRPNWVGLSCPIHLRTETDPVSETLWSFVFPHTRRWIESKINPIPLYDVLYLAISSAKNDEI
jgi:hypothetical protein